MPNTATDYLTVNVYDTISLSIVSNLFTGVSGYTSVLNYTKGNLAATAYRTRKSDDWNFKYYRYDVRGRVIKMWNIISGFDTLITDYSYNSQDQITDYSHTGLTDEKTYRNTYDYTGRLQKVEYYTGPPDAPNPEYTNLADYEYNLNSQISKQQFNDNNIENVYSYNNRNWIASMTNSQTIFDYTNSYFLNGNVKTAELSGDYNKNFANSSSLTFNYTYDKCNRLIDATTPGKSYNLGNTYDKDGNILTLYRNGSSANLIDDFNYVYYSGTNKLQRVTGSETQYTYDLNGNMISDDLSKNSVIKYDHRNLITELRHLEYNKFDSITYYTYYNYDEAGNRFAKTVYKYTGEGTPVDPPLEGSENPFWEIDKTEIYSRDVSGREMAIYKNDTLLEYPVYGLDMIGKIKDDALYFYIKDHLGSVRAVTDGSGSVISSQDYDAWGYLLENRTFESDSSKFKFTGKERDEESFYDYFGARYYDSRIGRWGQVDPQFDKSILLTPYQYGNLNPNFFVDPNGRDEIEIIFRTYIPQSYSVNPKYVVFHDNRGPSYQTTRYRTEQWSIVETDQSKSQSGYVDYVSDINYTEALQLTPSFEFIKTRGTGNLTMSPVSRVNTNTIEFSLTGTVSEQLVPFFSIDYEAVFTITKGENGVINITVKGVEDGFPAYEIWVRNITTGTESKLIYDRSIDRIEEIPNLAPILGDRNINIKNFEVK